MHRKEITRRQFVRGSAVLAVGLGLSPLVPEVFAKKKRTAVDQVPLGKTGLKLSRLGIGTGTRGGSVQRALGSEGFNKLIRYAYDQGITYIDTAQSYGTHTYVGEAIKSLPREKLFIQSKMGGVPENPLELLDQFRRDLGTDYIDSLLVHCVVNDNWPEQRKRVMDALQQAREKKIIRAHGVSCHSLPALTKSAQLDWVDVHLVRVNPQGAHMDTAVARWNASSDESHVPAVVEQIKIMRKKMI